MTQLEKSIFLSVFLTVCVSFTALFLLHPKIKNVLFPANLHFQSEQFSSAQKLWQFNDQFGFGYRDAPTNIVTEGPWLVDYPSLRGLHFPQVSILRSGKNYSLDLIVDDLISAQKIVASLPEIASSSDSLAIVKIYSPEEAAAANGYYFEDKSLHNKYWINISRYSL